MTNGIGSNFTNYSISSEHVQKSSGKETQGLQLTPDQIRNIETVLERNYKSDEPGCTCAIVQEGNVLWERSIGMAEPGGKARTSDIHQHVGSVSKQFTAMCVALLVDRGLVDLEADIRACIPSMRDMPIFQGPDGSPVTIRVKDLLHMQSGLPTSEAIVGFNGRADGDLTNDEKMVLVRSYLERNPKLPFKPGEKNAYCNTNYILLTELVSAKSNQSFREFAQTEIFDKLGMMNSGFIKSTGDDQMLKGYRKKGDDWEDFTTRNCTTGPCGVLATAADMAKWDGNFAHPTLGSNPERVLEIMRGPLQPPVNLENAWQPAMFKDTQYLGGLSVGRSIHDNFAVEVHAGGIEGFEAFICRARPLEGEGKPLTVFIACNQDMASNQERHIGEIGIRILEECLGKELIEPEDQTKKDNPAEAKVSTPVAKQVPQEQFGGKYHNPISGKECELVVSGDKLELLIPPLKEPFLTFQQAGNNPNVFQTFQGITIEFQNGNFSFDDGNTLRNHLFTRIV